MLKRALVAFSVALVLLGLFVTAIGWPEVLRALSGANPATFALAFVATLWALTARSLVWHWLLGTVDQHRPYWLVSAVFLTGMFAKYVTPYGQVTSGVGVAAVVSRYYESAYEESLAAIVSADVSNYLPYYTFGGMGLLGLLILDALPIDVIGYLPLTAAVLTTAVAGGVIAWVYRSMLQLGMLRIVDGIRWIVSRIAPRYATRFERRAVRQRFERFRETLALLSRDRSVMVRVLVAAHVGWLGLATALYLSALATGVELPIWTVWFAVAASKLGFLVPTPGGVGGVEITLATVLYLVAPVTVSVATAIALLYRFATYWFTILIGGCTSIALTVKDPLPP